MLASTLQFSNHHTTPPQAPTPQGARPGRRERNTTPDKGPGGPGTQQHAPHHCPPTPQGRRRLDPFPASKGRHPARRPGKGSIPSSAHHRAPTKLRRKEVIQPHLPVRLPCYDLVPITSLTLDGSIPQRVRPPASGAAHFHDLTGGVYKARERIHRDVADSRLLATPPSRSRVADCDPN